MTDDECGVLRLIHIQSFEQALPDGPISTSQEVIDDDPKDDPEEAECHGGRDLTE